MNNATCSCAQHDGKEMLNEVYNLNIHLLWEFLFGPTEFCYAYWESRKFYDVNVTDWKKQCNYVKVRTLEYMVDLGPFGRPKNIEEQKIIEYKPQNCIVLESESQTYGVLYSDYFTARNRFCITRVSDSQTRVLVHSLLNYNKKPNFIAKSFIDRNAMSVLSDSYKYLNAELPKKCNQIDEISDQISAMQDECLSNGLNIAQSETTLMSNVSDEEAYDIYDKDIVENDLDRKFSTEPYKRGINKRLSTSRKSVCSSYSEYLDVNNNSEQRPILSTQLSYPSLYSDANQPKLADLTKEDFEKPNYECNKENIKEVIKIKTIQTFSFLSYEINVDTLVRLFIIAMLCLMLINGLLYYKLIKIENLAHRVLTNTKLGNENSDSK